MNFQSAFRNAGVLKWLQSNCLLTGLVVILTFAAYSSAINNDFTNWDDNVYILNNKHIRDFSWESVNHIVTKRTGLGGTKLTLLSFMIDYRLWKLNPVPYHIENIIWHIINALLLFFLILRLTSNRNIAFVVAILFALHPMHIESVAWVSERKDVLYTFFLFLCLHAYLYYINTRKVIYRIFNWLAFTLLFYLSYHSKFSAVTIPFLLFLIDFYLKRKWSWVLIAEKLPVIAFAGWEVFRIVFGPHANMARIGKSVVKVLHPTDKFNFFDKLLLAAYALMFYLIRFIFPVHLSAIIPYPEKTGGSFPLIYTVAFIAAIILIVAAVLFLIRMKKNRHDFIFGLLFFLLTISVFLHFISIKGVVVVADRYTYVPYAGLGFIVGILLERTIPDKYRTHGWIGFAVFILLLGSATWTRNKVWENSITLFSDVLRKNPDVSIALNNRGNAYNDKGEYQLAIKDFDRGIRLSPRLKHLYNNRALAWFKLDSSKRAIEDLDKAIELDPGYLDAYLNKGNILFELKNTEGAIESYSRAISLAPRRAVIYLLRADVYRSMHNNEMAIRDYNNAIRVYPRKIDAWFSRGMTYLEEKNYDAAIKDFEKVKELDPDIAEAYNEIGNILNKKGDYHGAFEQLTKAIELNSHYAEAYNNRGITCFYMNNQDQALKDFDQAIAFDSAFAKAYANRGNYWVFQNDSSKALADYEKALSLNPDDHLTLMNRGNHLYSMGKKPDACRDWNRALKLGFTPAAELIESKCK
ncbi:MAG: tetratricopeptide repeat protein [Bacteroidales bacterium]|nr:tetratricopeptide repeat protein [Bacteroidales bacterium]